MPLWEKWRLSFNDSSPIYRQIVLQFNQAFARGDIAPGDRIPSIREMSAFLKVNTNTMQRVYQEMERDGLISSKRGTGYFFTEEREMTKETRRSLVLGSLRRFTDEMRALGCENNEIIDELKSFMKEGG
ncbi:MAG: GntR family transcriptional regulator [Treponema sp.]|nr:GntR family transcriptional regulator [Treponema sp.]MCL2272975.1 GntR family transcriptional regulator [Treponema sp.]